MHVIDEGRGEFRTATGAGDECREVLHGVFGFGGALEQQNSGVCEYSLYVDNQTDIPQETEAVQNFMDFSAQLYDKVIDFILEYKDELFKKSEAKKMTRKLAESAYSNNIISNDKEGNDQIKLKITKKFILIALN